MSRFWSPEQLAKWRIRKALPGEKPPWATTPGWEELLDKESQELGWQMADPEYVWFVWPPAGYDIVAASSSHIGAVRHIEVAEHQAAQMRMLERARAALEGGGSV